jgi:GT2 family glycosyltransferase/MFS family permease
VLAVLVVRDGEPWLDGTLAALMSQTHVNLDIVAVDNGSADASRERLLTHLDDDQVLSADIDLGYGAAVSMALDARAADRAGYVLLVHDDLMLAPDAVAALAATLDDDPRLAIVGPKLLEWDDPRQLQAVGWTIDLTGRVVPSVDEGELDQGQRDADRRTLYVSTAGMVVRRELLDRLGRLDRRYHLFRDDLDLCWRAWLTGHDVEVVPRAVATHAALAAGEMQLGSTGSLDARYFDERNTLATLLKNYGTARLLTVVPLYFLIGIAKVVGFVLTRRFADVWQTLRAWSWNGLHLVETIRLRRQVQAQRTRSDAELQELFGRITPRVRAYTEAIAAWVAGGDVGPVRADERPQTASEPETATARVVAAVRARPVLVAGSLLTVLILAGASSLLAPGELRGGELAPWPASPAAFLDDHLASWHTAAGLGTDVAPSPAQALLGLLHGAVFGSTYLAPRVLVLGTLLLAWVFALRATQRYSERKLPRVAAATAYVLSPPALVALTTGQIGGLVVLAALPGLVAAAGTFARSWTPPARAWRAAAGAALLGAVAGAFVPVLVPLIALVGVVLLVTALPAAPPRWRVPFASRVALATLGPFVLLLPWSLRLFAPDGPIRGAVAAEPVTSELWRWVLLVPEATGFPGPVAGVGFVLAGILGLLFGWRRQAGLVTVLWSVALAGAAAAWILGRTGSPVWSGLPLLATAAAFAGLLAVAFARGETALGHHAFGWRQIAAVATGVAVVVSLGAVAVDLVSGTGGTYVRNVPALPQFVTAAATPQDPFRVLVVADTEGVVRYEVVPGTGPSMAATGVATDPHGAAALAAATEDLISGRDVRAGPSLARLGVRFVVVPDGGSSERLDDALRRQVGLEPRPVASGRVLAVTDALPRASVVDEDAAARFVDTGVLPDAAEVTPLPVAADGGVRTTVPDAGVLLLTEPATDRWRATGDGAPLPTIDAPVVAFEVAEPGSRVEVEHAGQAGRSLALTGQLLAALLVVSLMLRPPGFARAADVAAADDSRARS